MSSGSYFPPPVRPWRSRSRRGVRVLGMPTVGDASRRWWSRCIWSPWWSRTSIPTPTGIGRGGRRWTRWRTRERCWRCDWVIDLDIKAFFDSVDHELVMKAVTPTPSTVGAAVRAAVVERPVSRPDGTVQERDRGSPQGSVVSPCWRISSCTMRSTLWMARIFPAVRFERYVDDVVVTPRARPGGARARRSGPDGRGPSGASPGEDPDRVLPGR